MDKATQDKIKVMEIFCNGTNTSEMTMGIIYGLVIDNTPVRELANKWDVTSSYIYKLKKKYKC